MNLAKAPVGPHRAVTLSVREHIRQALQRQDTWTLGPVEGRHCWASPVGPKVELGVRRDPSEQVIKAVVCQARPAQLSAARTPIAYRWRTPPQ